MGLPPLPNGCWAVIAKRPGEGWKATELMSDDCKKASIVEAADALGLPTDLVFLSGEYGGKPAMAEVTGGSYAIWSGGGVVFSEGDWQ